MKLECGFAINEIVFLIANLLYMLTIILLKDDMAMLTASNRL